MRTLLVPLLLFVPHVAVADSEPLYAAPRIEVAARPGGHLITFHVAPTPGAVIPTGAVPFTREPFNLLARFPDPKVQEGDVGGSGLTFDLDGDGGTTSAVPASCEPDGSARVGDARPAPLGFPMMRYAAERIARIGQRGAYVVLYSPCSSGGPVSFGLSDEPIPIERVPGPALQVVVFQRADTPTAEPKVHVDAIRLDGKPAVGAANALIRVYEPLFGPEPSWTAARWSMIPLGGVGPHIVEAEVRGGDLVVAMVNWSPVADTRTRGPVAAQPLVAGADPTRR